MKCPDCVKGDIIVPDEEPTHQPCKNPRCRRGELQDAVVLTGDVLECLERWPASSVSCVVTSPPYWSLRKYDAPEVVWGGDTECGHEWAAEAPLELDFRTHADDFNTRWHGSEQKHTKPPGGTAERATCALCGAWRGQYGLEPTPELYVEHTLLVLRAIRRVLRDDGVVFWNVGDGYASGGRGPGGDTEIGMVGGRSLPPLRAPMGLKPKDLVLMPFRVALAAQGDGWWVRSDIIWSKPNAMPESVTDRPTKAHEYIFMLTKSARYWYDADAVRDAPSPNNDGKRLAVPPHGAHVLEEGHGTKYEVRSYDVIKGRNLRTVWEFPTAQTPGAHFATFPEELPARCIRASCPKDGLVLDPFCGTGTTGIVARRLDRQFVGIELSPKYAEMAREKLAHWWRPTRLVEAEIPEGQAVLWPPPASGGSDG